MSSFKRRLGFYCKTQRLLPVEFWNEHSARSIGSFSSLRQSQVVNSWNASRLARQDWLDETPFGVRECASHARGAFSGFESHDRLRTPPEMRPGPTSTENPRTRP